MKNPFVFILFFVFAAFSAQAQLTITGALKDTTDKAISSATVMLLNPKDSTLANYTSSDAKGNFSFKNIRKTNYILKTSHISYMPREIFITPTDEKEINLGEIEMKPIANFLMEIVIKEAKAPIFIKGDTVEYDASTFKVPPGSTVEDLLRKLPGIEVDAEGNISTMGKDVRTVYVDGKSFFGNDPKTVTQNLDAQAVSKVQVFTEKSEQEKLTGISDGSKEKVMNLELKDEYKKGYFGKASAGYGWGENALHRWLAKGNFNWFTDKQQLSIIGYGNNLNQTNLDWNDMQEFRGQSMQTGFDNGDFGFNSDQYGGRRFYYYGSDGFDGTGFSNSGGGGVNYNYYDKKIKFNAGYLYTVNKTFSDVFSNRNTFLKDSSFWRMDTTHNDNLRQNHNFSTRFEYQIDSTNNIILRANLGYIPNTRSYFTKQLYQTQDFENINLLSVDNKYRNDNLNFDFLTIYNHKFKKKGRSFSISGFYNYKEGNNWEDIKNVNEFYSLVSLSEQIKFYVKNNKNSEDHNIKSSILYVEPLGKRFSLLGFYNIRNTLSYSKNYSKDSIHLDIDSLWLDYRNNTLYNRVGSSINYGHNGINLTLGGAFQALIIKGSCETRPHAIEKLRTTPYYNFIPYFSADIELPKNVNIEASYSYDVSEPDISYLFPMPNLSNTMFRIEGNPSLTPEHFHSIEGDIYYWNSASMVNVSLNVGAKFYDNQIVYNQTTNFEENKGYVTTSFPDNVKGGNSFSTYLWSNFPIVKTVLTMNISVNGGISNSPIFINEIKNNTNSKNYGARVGLNLTVGQRLNFNAGANVYQTFTKYSIQTDRNQNYINYSASLTGKWQVFKKTYLEGTYRFTNYSNKKLDFTQNLHILNLSLRQVIGKKNQWELRFAAMDILNQNEYVRQFAATNYIEYRTAPTLARYFLLTVSYNIKGFEVKNTDARKRVVVRN
ncbi:MAG: TonB-dependent receptor family protein [Bacteroidales bacterium]|nr:TonB-dependent receptor family protein [Bacteroidales bacterium]